MGSGTMGAGPGARLSLLPWRLAEQTPHLPLRHHVTGSPGMGVAGQGRKAETRL